MASAPEDEVLHEGSEGAVVAAASEPEAPAAGSERLSLKHLPVEAMRAIALEAGLRALRALAETSTELSQGVSEIGIISCRRCPQLWVDSGRPLKTCSFHGCNGWPCAPDLTRHLAKR